MNDLSGNLPHPRIREFLYLDQELVVQCLAQLNLGLFKDWQQSVERVSGKDLGLSVGAMSLAIKASGERTAKEAEAIVLEQTAESYIARLLLQLENEEQLVRLGSEESHLSRRGTVLEGSGRFEAFDPLSHERFQTGRPTMDAALQADPYVIIGERWSAVAIREASHERVPQSVIFEDDLEFVGILRRRESISGEVFFLLRLIAIY